MKITITIDSNPIGGTKTTINIDDEAPVETITGGPIAITPPANTVVAVAGEDLESGDIVAFRPNEKSSPTTTVRKALTAHKSVEKICDGCGDTFTASGTGMNKRKFCDPCKERRATKPTTSRAAPGRGPAKQYPSEPTGPAPHIDESKPAPQFLPGYEKTPEEIEAIRTSFPIEPAPVHSDMPSTKLSSSNFADPWDCQKCRDHMHVCDFHASMEADGKRPPVGRAPGY